MTIIDYRYLNHPQFGSWTYSENLLNLELLENNIRYEDELNEHGLKDNISIADDGIGEFVVVFNHLISP